MTDGANIKAIKFKTSWNRIERIEIERESASCVWVNGRKRAKHTSWESYFNSFEEAKASLVQEAEEEVESAKADLQRARSKLGNAQSLKDLGEPGGAK